MEILKRGVLPGEVKYIATCISCDSELRATHAELENYEDDHGVEWNRGTCPVCDFTLVYFEKERT